MTPEESATRGDELGRNERVGDRRSEGVTGRPSTETDPVASPPAAPKAQWQPTDPRRGALHLFPDMRRLRCEFDRLVGAIADPRLEPSAAGLQHRLPVVQYRRHGRRPLCGADRRRDRAPAAVARQPRMDTELALCRRHRLHCYHRARRDAIRDPPAGDLLSRHDDHRQCDLRQALSGAHADERPRLGTRRHRRGASRRLSIVARRA